MDGRYNIDVRAMYQRLPEATGDPDCVSDMAGLLGELNCLEKKQDAVIAEARKAWQTMILKLQRMGWSQEDLEQAGFCSASGVPVPASLMRDKCALVAALRYYQQAVGRGAMNVVNVDDLATVGGRFPRPTYQELDKIVETIERFV
jgi:hypothetical protein